MVAGMIARTLLPAAVTFLSSIGISEGLQTAASGDSFANIRVVDSVGDIKHLTVRKIIHQTWKTHDLPPAFQKWSKSWQDCLPDWEHRVYDDRDNHDFVAKHFPEHLEMFDAYPKPIFRADAIRYMYLAAEGGLYVDMDMECLRDPLPLLRRAQSPVIMACEGCHQISNSFMFADVEGQEFFRRVVQRLPEGRHDSFVLRATGPLFLTRAVKGLVHNFSASNWTTEGHGINEIRHLNGSWISVLDDKFIFAKSFAEAQNHRGCSAQDTASCRQAYPEAIAVSHWTNTWRKGGSIPNVTGVYNLKED